LRPASPGATGDPRNGSRDASGTGTGAAAGNSVRSEHDTGNSAGDSATAGSATAGSATAGSATAGSGTVESGTVGTAGDGTGGSGAGGSGHGSGESTRLLVCFPHAGGAATAYAPLAAALPAAVDVVALQYPGRQERLSEPSLDSVDDLVAAIVPELWPVLDRPFAFFGHSAGAIVAFEAARVLEQRYGTVALGLFASGRRGPSTRREEQVHRGGDRSLLREVARLGGTPAHLLDDEDVQQMLLPALRGDYKAIETYEWRPGPPLQCPIWALLGDDDPLATEAEAAAWRSQTTGGFELHVFPGRHFYLVDQQPAVVDLIARHLLP
jgi:surfactin synthase thioesterase subunit